MICKTCKHWGSDNDSDGLKGTKLCQAIRHEYVLTQNLIEECGEPEYSSKEQWDEYRESGRMDEVLKNYDKLLAERLEKSTAYVVDGSLYWAGLYTTSKFSCSLWEKK